MKTRWLAALGIACAALVSTASADEVRWDQYLHETDIGRQSRNRAYLDGAIDALVGYNDQVRGAHRKVPLFCLPSRFPLTNQQADSIMRRFAAKQPQDIGVVPTAVVLLGGLMDIFPCQTSP